MDPMRHLLLLSVPLLTLLTMLTVATSCAGESAKVVTCGQPGQWRLTDTGPSAPLEGGPLLERLARQQVVLLGEVHDSAEVASRLVDAGADAEGSPVETPWGDRNARVRAPDGMQLTLFTSP